MQIKIFVTYYLISGLLVMAYAHKNYNKIIDAMPLMDMFSKEALLIIQFFTGFFQIPIIILVKIYGLILSVRLKILIERNKRVSEKNAIIKHVSDELFKVIESSQKTFSDEGHIPYIVLLFVNTEKTVKIIVSCSTEEEERWALEQIKTMCSVEKAVATLVISEATTIIDDERRDIIALDFESSWFSQGFTIDVDKGKKSVGEKRRCDIQPFFLPYLKNISK